MKAKLKIQNLYSGLGWTSYFTAIRFWTGAFEELEKNLPKKGRILDLGCGYGIFSNYIGLCSPQREIVGYEIDKKKLKFANRGLVNVSFLQDDVTKIKLPRSDAIVIADVLHHLKSYQKQDDLVKKCHQSLKKKGFLLISEVDSRPFWKLILGRITDFILYPKGAVYYRYSPEMMILLKKYFNVDKIKMITPKNNPFPHVIYQCQKD